MLTVIGDCHGEYIRYKRIIKEHEYTVQIGDMGYDYRPLIDVNSDSHKFFGGNHDDYEVYGLLPHQLGNYGLRKLGGIEFYFIRGAFSIDKNYRTPGIDWFPQEELNWDQRQECAADYERVRPKIVLSHDCPDFIAKAIGSSETLEWFGWNAETFLTDTQVLLEVLAVIHQPDLWIFGHHHKHFDEKIGNTRFICLPELATFTLE